jgi:uncharacterized protein YcnI
MSFTTLRRAATVTALTASAVLAAAGAAFAHVTVHPESYAKGATDGTLTFRVPNEEDGASTTKVQVFFPTDHPVLGVLVGPIPGWTATTTTTRLKTPVTTDDGTITEAVSEVTWTKGTIKPGQYQDFSVAFGQLPEDASELAFKTLQTYSDGKVARWIEEAQSGQEEPENPVPVLTLTTAADAGTASPKASASAAPASATVPASATTDDSTARTIGIAGLAVGLLGLAAAAFAITRGRRPSA